MKDNTFKARACVMAVGLVGLAGHLGQAQAQGGPPAAGAQAPSVQLYGTIDLGVGRIESQPPGPPGAPIVGGTRMQNGGLTTSFIGLRGTEQLSDGLRASSSSSHSCGPTQAKVDALAPRDHHKILSFPGAWWVWRATSAT
jgi:hypothetical protein